MASGAGDDIVASPWERTLRTLGAPPDASHHHLRVPSRYDALSLLRARRSCRLSPFASRTLALACRPEVLPGRGRTLAQRWIRAAECGQMVHAGYPSARHTQRAVLAFHPPVHRCRGGHPSPQQYLRFRTALVTRESAVCVAARSTSTPAVFTLLLQPALNGVSWRSKLNAHPLVPACRTAAAVAAAAECVAAASGGGGGGRA